MRFETHCHSHYSNIRLIDSICKPEDLILTASKLGYSGIALTDHEALCGHIDWLILEKRFKEEDKISKDFKCALGNEIYLVKNRNYKENKIKYYHFILIAKNEIGWRALRELSSNSWLNSYVDRRMERVPTLYTELEAIVNKYPNSLIATSACLGSELDEAVLNLIDAEKKSDQQLIFQYKQVINDLIMWYLKLFNDDFYIEIAPGSSPEQKNFNKRIKSIAEYYNIKIVIGTDAHYLTADKRNIHRAFLNSKDGDREVDSFYHDAHLMSDTEAYNNLKDIYTFNEFNKICENSNEIYNKISPYNIFHNPIIPEVKVKDYNKNDLEYDTLIKTYPNLYYLYHSENIQERYWINECLNGLNKKDKLKENIYLDRLEIEADVLRTISLKLQNCMFSYFNTFQHYIDIFWECGSIVGPGRGSACGFLSNYLLGITQLDPIKWDLPWFRFLNKERAELPDIDIDLCSAKRGLIFEKIREERGKLNVVQVATFGIEAPKAAIACACRGYRSKDLPNGIDVDIAHYMSSLIPVERGFTRSISDCIYGNEEKNYNPIKELVNQFNQYPGLLEIVLEIEGIVCRRGQHASGVMMYNNSPYETTALMKSPNGDITTQFDLHKSELLGDTKFDYLVTEISDKISIAIDLLKRDGYFESNLSKREIYNKYFHPEVIDIKDQNLWEKLISGTVLDVFQFNTQIGKEAIKQIKPHSPIELTAANALIRLTAPEGQERPFDRYVKFKNNINLWYQEMDDFGLTKNEQKILEPYYLQDYGVPASQEAMMRLTMDDNIANFTLAEANNARKIVGKKKIKEVPALKEKFISQCPSINLGKYAWRTMMEPQMSYSFSINHATPYSFVGIQTVLIAYKYPEIYWNTACLIVNSAAANFLNVNYNDSGEEELDDIDIEDSINAETNSTEEIVPINEVEDEDYEYEDLPDRKGKKKKANTTNYGKIGTALGEIQKFGIIISPPDINNSDYTFRPNRINNSIMYGLSGINKIGVDLVEQIIQNRPYLSPNDLAAKVKINKTQIINLIKAGAFDNFGDSRESIMRAYITSIADQKNDLNLRNIQMLIKYNLLPDSLSFETKVFNFNKFIKKNCLDGDYYILTDYPLSFYENNIDSDDLYYDDTTSAKVPCSIWDKRYKKYMEKVKIYIKDNKKELLDNLNQILYNEVYNKYCEGSISKWEMDSISYYNHEHELANVNMIEEGFSNFFKLSEEPIVDKVFNTKDGKQIPLFKIYRIAGTVLDKDKNKKIIQLLTTTGVVTVKIFGDAFVKYDKQISEIGADGKKHVIEKSLVARGNKIIITGLRRGDSFVAKKYRNTPWHLIEQITSIHDDGTIEVTTRE